MVIIIIIIFQLSIKVLLLSISVFLFLAAAVRVAIFNQLFNIICLAYALPFQSINMMSAFNVCLSVSKLLMIKASPVTLTPRTTWGGEGGVGSRNHQVSTPLASLLRPRFSLRPGKSKVKIQWREQITLFRIVQV